VDLRGRFSNPEVRAVVAQVTQAIAGVKVDSGDEPSPPLSGPRWRLIDRLGEQIIQEMLHDSHSGATQRSLAERYGISLSSVKRVLHRHRR
jgi:DNA invertase Pin-like site-specific DNA recombinase